jgi:hypothetical protein
MAGTTIVAAWRNLPQTAALFLHASGLNRFADFHPDLVLLDAHYLR